ncbi:MAG: hypothetical protein Q9212_004564 [Teloschistes hypoglaucus]
MRPTRLRNRRAQQLRKESEQTDRRFPELKGHIRELEGKIKAQEDRENLMTAWISGLMTKVDRIPCGSNNTPEAQDMISNGLVSRGWEIIRPIPARRGDNNGKLPANFPRTVRQFWKLKAKEHRQDIVSLLVFYHTEVLDECILDLDPNDSDSDSRSDSCSDSRSYPDSDTGTDAQHRIRNNIIRGAHVVVRYHPKRAHRTLAVELGLDYSRIEASMHKERRKRHREEDRDRRERKRQRHE